MAITVLVADDHEVVRNGIAAMLKGTAIKIIGEATRIDETVSQTLLKKPDLVLLDIRMGNDDGFEALEKLRNKLPRLRSVVFSAYDSPTYIARAVSLGARDYLLKGCSRQDLVDSITHACLAESDSNAIVRCFGESKQDGRRLKEPSSLTDRESRSCDT